MSHDDNEQWKLISLQRRGRPVKLQEMQMMYVGLRPVAKAKVDDVKSLCVYIPPIDGVCWKNSSGTSRKNIAKAVVTWTVIGEQ